MQWINLCQSVIRVFTESWPWIELWWRHDWSSPLFFITPSTGRSRCCFADEDIRGFHPPHRRIPEAFPEFPSRYQQPQWVSSNAARYKMMSHQSQCLKTFTYLDCRFLLTSSLTSALYFALRWVLNVSGISCLSSDNHPARAGVSSF